jgi:hypothetical protein
MAAMNGTNQLGRLSWTLARAMLAEARFKAGKHGEETRAGGNATWIALAILITLAALPVLVGGENIGAFLGIQAALLTLVVVAAAGQFRDRGIVSFLSSMPLLPGAANRVAARAVLLASITPAVIYPVLAVIALLIARLDATFSIMAAVSSALVSTWPICLSRMLASTLLRPVKRKTKGAGQEPSIAVRTGSPSVSIGRALVEITFHDARHAATVLAPAVAALAIILAGFTFQMDDPTFAFFWLYILTGLLPFFISSAVTGAGDRLASGFGALPGFDRRLLGVKQAISGTIFLAIMTASVAYAAYHVTDPGMFLLLAAGLPFTGWFSCSITLLALDALGRITRVGRHFLALILAFNIFGSMFWNLSMVDPLGPAAMVATTVATGLAGIVLLEVLKRLTYRLVG